MRQELKDEEYNKLVREIWPLTKGFDVLPDHVVITDPHGNIVYANKAVAENTGFTKSEVLKNNPGDLWGGQMPKEFYEKMWQTIRDFKLPFAGKVKNRRKDGTEYWQELRIYPLLNEAGEIKAYIGMEPNINIAKIQEENKNKYYGEMERLHDFLMKKARRVEELEKELAALSEQFGE